VDGGVGGGAVVVRVCVCGGADSASIAAAAFEACDGLESERSKFDSICVSLMLERCGAVHGKQGVSRRYLEVRWTPKCSIQPSIKRSKVAGLRYVMLMFHLKWHAPGTNAHCPPLCVC
jgi:hypothetical protein